VSMETICDGQSQRVAAPREGEDMKAAVIEEFGATPQYREVPDPEPGEGMQVARVRAAAIKNIERMLVAGDHYGSGGMSMPAQVGLDAVVELTDGRRVYRGDPTIGGDGRLSGGLGQLVRSGAR